MNVKHSIQNAQASHYTHKQVIPHTITRQCNYCSGEVCFTVWTKPCLLLLPLLQPKKFKNQLRYDSLSVDWHRENTLPDVRECKCTSGDEHESTWKRAPRNNIRNHSAGEARPGREHDTHSAPDSLRPAQVRATRSRGAITGATHASRAPGRARRAPSGTELSWTELDAHRSTCLLRSKFHNHVWPGLRSYSLYREAA